ncbi:uncharacterized protein BDV17DRAFT_58274 [Aspergillus undulatus]|uniref:uncharacterized protein n=1 Tax=Aspergillus undulatus TaxID=1810928 RepID=UPI003CCCE3E5
MFSSAKPIFSPFPFSALALYAFYLSPLASFLGILAFFFPFGSWNAYCLCVFSPLLLSVHSSSVPRRNGGPDFIELTVGGHWRNDWSNRLITIASGRSLICPIDLGIQLMSS